VFSRTSGGLQQASFFVFLERVRGPDIRVGVDASPFAALVLSGHQDAKTGVRAKARCPRYPVFKTMAVDKFYFNVLMVLFNAMAARLSAYDVPVSNIMPSRPFSGYNCRTGMGFRLYP
jgi:hypothetical protein